jgi:hypothetical protein
LFLSTGLKGDFVSIDFFLFRSQTDNNTSSIAVNKLTQSSSNSSQTPINLELSTVNTIPEKMSPILKRKRKRKKSIDTKSPFSPVDKNKRRKLTDSKYFSFGNENDSEEVDEGQPEKQQQQVEKKKEIIMKKNTKTLRKETEQAKNKETKDNNKNNTRTHLLLKNNNNTLF